MAEREPFDPKRVRPAQGELGLGGPGPGLFTVRQVTEMVRAALAQCLPPTLHVVGEIGNLSRPGSGHLYFTLKDASSELPCVMWRSAAARLKFEPQVGMEVIATGALDVYAARGVYQLYVRRLEPRGIGALELAFRQLKERLAAEGLFDPARKRPLPRFPQRVAVVTSPSGAAIRDILQTLRRRFPGLTVLLFPVRVQGEGAAEEIAEAIRRMNRWAGRLGGIDVAIVGRGGGSLEDLWAFNEEVVARAIADSRIPIVSAVGHEVDVSIADLVADVRAATPTAAAELVAPHAGELLEWIAQRQGRVERAARHALTLAEARRKQLLVRMDLVHPRRRIREHAQQLDEMLMRFVHAAHERLRMGRARLHRAQMALVRFGGGAAFRRLREMVAARVYRLHRALGHPVMRGERALAAVVGRLERASPARRLERLDEHLRHSRRRLKLALEHGQSLRRQRLRTCEEALAAYDPRRVLRRGYSITRVAGARRVIRSVNQVREGLRLTTEVADGTFHSTAEDPRQPRLFEGEDGAGDAAARSE